MNKPAKITSWPENLPDRRLINGDLQGARNITMQSLIGLPRGTFSAHCQEPTNPDFISLLTHEDVGPFRIRGLRLGLRIDTDGLFGPLTHAVVVQFQKREGLVPDGIAGPRTLEVLGISGS